MPIVNIQILQGRNVEKVTELMRRVADTVSDTLAVPKENVRVIVTEVPKTHWSVAGVPLSERPSR